MIDLIKLGRDYVLENLKLEYAIKLYELCKA